MREGSEEERSGPRAGRREGSGGGEVAWRA
jgi:hypothetical protein